MAASGGRDEADATVILESLGSLEEPSKKPSRELHGYPLEIFPAGFDNKFKCTHCKLILKDPQQGLCGHRFCRVCVEFIKTRNQQSGKDDNCPGCVDDNLDDEEDIKLQPDKMFRDNAVKREMSTVKVICCNKECTWAGPFKQYPIHHRDCPHQEVSCDCGQLMPKLRLTEHQDTECLKRNIACKFCAQQVLFLQKEEHNLSCLKFPVKCNSCGKKRIPKDKLEEHMNVECPTPKLRCPLGCAEMVERSKLDQHLKSNLSSHFTATQEKIDSMEQMIEQRLSLSGGAESLESFFAATRDKLTDFEHKLENLSGGVVASIQGAEGGATSTGNLYEIAERVKTYEDIMRVLYLENRRLVAAFETLDQQRKMDKTIQEKQEEKIRTLERILALKDVSLAEVDLRLTSLELISYDGILVWKITDFQRKRQEAITGKTTSIYSPAFFTSRMGYKMCARLYPNGDGMGKGSHLSLFFVLMRGHYDNLLKFPFKEKVTMMLLDQSGREKADHVVDAFRPDPSSSSFKKPTTEMNIASGCPLFMSLTQLNNVSAKYIFEDNVFIKIVVDCKDN